MCSSFFLLYLVLAGVEMFTHAVPFWNSTSSQEKYGPVRSNSVRSKMKTQCKNGQNYIRLLGKQSFGMNTGYLHKILTWTRIAQYRYTPSIHYTHYNVTITPPPHTCTGSAWVSQTKRLSTCALWILWHLVRAENISLNCTIRKILSTFCAASFREAVFL